MGWCVFVFESLSERVCVRDSVCVREREWDAGCERGREVEVREEGRKRERGID